jgi:hypothetical protein
MSKYFRSLYYGQSAIKTEKSTKDSSLLITRLDLAIRRYTYIDSMITFRRTAYKWRKDIFINIVHLWSKLTNSLCMYIK